MTKCASMAELRLNPLSDEWVVIAADRQERVYRPPLEDCPLCPTSVNVDEFSEIPFDEFEVAVFENRFLALSTNADDDDGVNRTDPYQSAPAYGHCEVVVYSDDHQQTFSDLSIERVQLLIDVWIDRCTTLGSDAGVHYVLPFENKGERVGATLGHPHGQIYAFPYIPPRVRQHLVAAKNYLMARQRCAQCDVCVREIDTTERLLMDTKSWLVFVPFAPQFPYESHVVPKRHLSSLGALNEEEKLELATVLSSLTKSYDRLWDFSLPYVMAIHQRPVNDEMEWDRFCHLRFEFKPVNRGATNIKFLAGVELAAGTFIVDVRPEDAAAQLRTALR